MNTAQQGIHEAVEALIAPFRHPALVRQVARVALRLSGDVTLPCAPHMLVSLYMKHRLLPAAERLETYFPHVEHLQGMSLRAAAVALAACAYPERITRWQHTELVRRTGVFLERLRLVAREGTAPAQSLWPALNDDERHRLLTVFAGTGNVPGGADAGATELRTLQYDGALWYLATCSVPLSERIRNNIDREGALVTAIRTHMQTPPSLVAGTAGVRGLQERMAQTLALLLGRDDIVGSLSQNHVKDLVRLELSLWRSACKALGEQTERVGGGAGVSPAARAVEAGWAYLYQQLTTGFPHFAFRSQLTTWWYRIAQNIDYTAFKGSPVPPDYGEGLAGVCDTHNFDLKTLFDSDEDMLVFFREGYRLVRSTFFVRSDQLDKWMPETETDNLDKIAAANEALRAHLDDLYGKFLQAPAAAHGETMAEDVAEDTRETPDNEVKEKTNRTYIQRLQVRMRDYALARLLGLDNHEIRQELPKWETQLERIAVAGRVVPPEESLLPICTADWCLRNAVYPNERDPWSLSRFLPELWGWLKDHGAQPLRGRQYGAKRARELLEEPPIRELAQQLEACNSRQEVQAYIKGQSFTEEAERARDWLREITHRVTWGPVLAQLMKRIKPPVKPYWIVPAWYLLLVNGEQPERAYNLLHPTAAESDGVRAIVNELVRIRIQLTQDGTLPEPYGQHNE